MTEKRLAVVTGAARGIGRAIVFELLKQGRMVAGLDIIDDQLKDLEKAVQEAGFEVVTRCLDITLSAKLTEVLESLASDYGGIGILVNNAGITRDNLAMRMKDDEWDAVIDTNLKAVFRLSKAVMRGMMKARTGRIINITSVVGHAGNPGQANYCAAKAGVSGMTRSLARELGSRNITVNCVAPGFIDTDMTKSLDEKQKESLLAGIPLGRLGRPEDIAAAVAYLASPAAAYVTGSTLHVNGGMYMD